MAPKRYKFVGERVFDDIGQAPPEVKSAFFKLLEGLAPDPHLPGAAHLDVLPLKDPRFVAAYTAPYDEGLLLYQVKADFPVVYLVDVLWFET